MDIENRQGQPETRAQVDGRSAPLLLKLGASLFLVYHIAAIVILPNSSSLLGRSLADFVLPYANMFGFNTTWQFFSPGPAATYYLEYQVETKANEDNIDSPTLQYPPMREHRAWDDFFQRRLYAMRFFTLFPDRLEQYFVPYICRTSPGATAVWVQPIFERPPSIERAGQAPLSGADNFAKLGERTDMPRSRIECPSSAGTQLLPESQTPGGSP